MSDETHMCDCEFCNWRGHVPGDEPMLRNAVIRLAKTLVETSAALERHVRALEAAERDE